MAELKVYSTSQTPSQSSPVSILFDSPPGRYSLPRIAFSRQSQRLIRTDSEARTRSVGFICLGGRAVPHKDINKEWLAQGVEAMQQQINSYQYRAGRVAGTGTGSSTDLACICGRCGGWLTLTRPALTPDSNHGRCQENPCDTRHTVTIDCASGVGFSQNQHSRLVQVLCSEVYTGLYEAQSCKVWAHHF